MIMAYYEIHTILTFGKDLDTICWGSYNEEKTLTFLQEATIQFHSNFTHHTFGSVKYFGLSIVEEWR